MRLKCLVIAVIGFLSVFAPQKAQTADVAIKFADVVPSGLIPGMAYSIKKEKGIPFVVMNKSDSTFEVEIMVDKPAKKYLKEGYELIPDARWIKVFPNNFRLGPRENMECDLIIIIPEGEMYENKNFQASLISEAKILSGNKGVGLTFSLERRFRFATGTSAKKKKSKEVGKIVEAMGIKLYPQSLYTDVSPGKKIILGRENYPCLKLANYSRSNFKIELKIKNKDGFAENYESIPDIGWVKLKKNRMKLKSGKVENVEIELKIPGNDENKQKNFAFTIVADILGLNFPMEVHAMIYVKTEE